MMGTNRIHERYTLNETERLKLRKQIETLFQTGKAFSVHPIRVLFLIVPRLPGEISPVRVGFVIPKKRRKKAVDRNRIKRLLKESWRLQKHSLYAQIPESQQLHVFFVFNGKENLNFQKAFETTGKIMLELGKIIQS